MEITVAAQASNRRIFLFKLATIAGIDLEAEAVMQDCSKVRRFEGWYTEEYVQDSASFVEVISKHLVHNQLHPAVTTTKLSLLFSKFHSVLFYLQQPCINLSVSLGVFINYLNPTSRQSAGSRPPSTP